MDGGEGGYVDEIILCVGGGVSKRKPKEKTRFSMRKFYFFFGIARNVGYQA